MKTIDFFFEESKFELLFGKIGICIHIYEHQKLLASVASKELTVLVHRPPALLKRDPMKHLQLTIMEARCLQLRTKKPAQFGQKNDLVISYLKIHFLRKNLY